MSAVFKRLERRDAFITPYTAHKSFTFTSSSFGEVGIEVFHAKSGSFPYNTEHLRYVGATRTLSEDNYPYSQEYSRQDYLGKELNVFSIPRNLYGLSILPGSITLTIPNSGSFTDKDGYLYASGQSGVVGQVNYSAGIVALTTGQYTGSTYVTSTSPVTMSFRASEPILTYNYHCSVEPNEFNYSYNPSLQDPTSDISGSLKSMTTHPEFRVYATTIGLYNDTGELLAIGKLSQATPIMQNTPYTFVVKLDL